MRVFTGKELFESFGGIQRALDDMEQMCQPRPVWWRRALLRLAGYNWRDFRPIRRDKVPS